MISIKEKLIARIKANKDEVLLKEIYDLLEAEEKETIQFSEEMQNKIKESKEAYQKGNVITDEEMQKKLDRVARRIIWTEPAVNELKAIINFWTDKNKSSTYSIKIRNVLRQNLKLIAVQPAIGRKTNLPDIKAKLMLNHFLIIYRIGKNNELVILNFWDCRQNPELNKYI